MRRSSGVLLLLGAAVVLGCLLGAASGAVPFKRSANEWREEQHDESNTEEPSTFWQALGRSMLPSGAMNMGREDIIKFLDAVDKIYGYIFAGEKTRLRDRDPTAFAQIESLLREAGETDSHFAADGSRSKRDADEESDANLETCNGVGYLAPTNAMIVRSKFRCFELQNCSQSNGFLNIFRLTFGVEQMRGSPVSFSGA